MEVGVVVVEHCPDRGVDGVVFFLALVLTFTFSLDIIPRYQANSFPCRRA